MAFTNVYIGTENDLALYNGDDIIGFTFTVLNADGTAYSFTGNTDINLKIYTNRTRTTISKTILAADLSIASNVVTWSSDYSVAIALANGLYFYDLTWEDSASKPITVTFGDMKIV